MVYKNTHHEWNLLVNYSYLTDGTKFSALDDDGGGLLYRGSLIYRKTEGEIALESILFEGGRFVPNCGPMLHVTDHLGSVRAVVNALSGEVTEMSDYFPFGMRMDIWSAVEDESNRYRFNDKEDQEGEFGVPTLDYGARHYSATSARWLSMDPLADKYYSISPYAFCNNNPVNFVDPDGELPAPVVGAPVVALGTEVAIAGAKTTAAGMILMANSAQNKSGGYERGNNNTSKRNANQLQQDIGKGEYEKPHVHFKDGHALNNDGTWKHGGRDLTNKEKKFLDKYDW